MERWVINVRGTNGSGKTTLARVLLKESTELKIMKVAGEDCHIHLPGPVAFVGRYPEKSWTGGADRIVTVEGLLNVVEEASKHAHVFVEGFLLTGLQATTKRMAEAAERSGASFQAITLNTSMDQCIQNTLERRRKAGNDKPLNPQNLLDKNRAAELALVKFEAWGIKSSVMSWDDAYKECKRCFGW